MDKNEYLGLSANEKLYLVSGTSFFLNDGAGFILLASGVGFEPIANPISINPANPMIGSFLRPEFIACGFKLVSDIRRNVFTFGLC